jgi:hypothetical protein
MSRLPTESDTNNRPISNRTMSKASTTFGVSIEDASTLLRLFDEVHKTSPERAEVLKRAGLVMALTAWETYVEDRLYEAVEIRLQAVSGSSIGRFISHKLAEELKRLHNPTPEKVKQLFIEFLEVDVIARWKWDNYSAAEARKTLGNLIAKRGEAAHRSKPVKSGAPAPDLVKRDDLEKAIRFLCGLVTATEKALAE